MKKTSKSKLLKKFESYTSFPHTVDYPSISPLKIKPFIKQISDILIPESQTDKISNIYQQFSSNKNLNLFKKQASRIITRESGSTMASIHCHGYSGLSKSPERNSLSQKQSKVRPSPGKVFRVKSCRKVSFVKFKQIVSNTIDEYFAGTSLAQSWCSGRQALELNFSMEKHQNSITGLLKLQSHLWTTSSDYSIRSWPIPQQSSDPYKSPEFRLGSTLTNYIQIGKHSRPITSISSHSSSPIIATGSKEGAIKFWTDSGNQVHLAHHSPGLASLLFLSKGQILSGGQSMQFFDLNQMSQFRDEISNESCKVLKSHKENTFFSSGSSGKIKLWDVRAPRSIITLSQHADEVTGLESWTETQILSCGLDAQIKVWDLRKSDCVKKLEYGNGFNGIQRLGDKVFTCGKQVCLWDLQKMEVCGVIDKKCKVIKVEEDSLVTGGFDGVVNSWKVNNFCI